MSILKYHRRAYVPTELDELANKLIHMRFKYSKHLNEDLNQHYRPNHCVNRTILRNTILRLQNDTTVEPFKYEVEDDNLKNFVVRTEYDEEYDISIVFSPKTDLMLVVTAWVNRKDDNHLNQDLSYYVQAPNH